MKNIKIFLAGSKDLIKERNSIKILANDLNSSYHSSGFTVTIYSYEHFNDKQNEYHRFIEEEADVVIFILDGKIGTHTEGEFLKAADTLNKENRPELILFLHEFSTLTPDIARIQGLIAGRLGDKYYVDYSSIDDLKVKTRERIERFIKKQEALSIQTKTKSKSTNGHCNIINGKVKILVSLLVGTIFCLIGGLMWSLNRTPDMLIFAGGGSVKNYIEETKRLNIKDYPNAIYANLASGSAWALLTEEANRYQEDGVGGQEHFSSICLSADDIDSTFFNEKTIGIFANARIIRYHLGTDPLVIYVHHELLKDKGIPKEAVSISEDSLCSLVKYVLSEPNNLRLFTTSKTSGTLRLYQSCFREENQLDLEKLLDSKKSYLFYKNSTSSYINGLDEVDKNLPYLILGSKYYYPNTLKTETNNQYQALYVTREEENICKPMNIYFVGRYNENEPDFCTIRKPVVRFLKDIQAEINIDKGIWQDLLKGRIKAEGTNLILSLN